MATSERKAIVVGISGASSSGKTTLARLLRDIFPSTFVLHEDDFYKPEKDIPMTNGLMDWDRAEALVIPDIASTLSHIQQYGTLPIGSEFSKPDFESKEDRNSIGDCPVSDEFIADMKEQVRNWAESNNTLSNRKLCIFDGFLLYSHSMESIQHTLDLKLFLRVPYEKAKARREARDGYATIEGFWKDPPGYVDKIVWPNYVKDHSFLFQDGDVDGAFNEDVLAAHEILIPQIEDGSPGDEADMQTTLNWAVQAIMKKLEEPETVH